MTETKTLASEREALEAEHAKKVAELERKHAILSQLPDDLPTPRHVHVRNLYGEQVSLSYGSSFAHGETLTLREALDIVNAVGETEPVYVVKNSCTSIKSENAITDDEEENAKISGPYGVRVEHDSFGAKLIALVWVGKMLTRIECALSRPYRFGGWRRTDGRQDIEVATWEAVGPIQGDIGHAAAFRYASGSHRGPHAKSRHVVLWHHISDLEFVADKESEQ